MALVHGADLDFADVTVRDRNDDTKSRAEWA